MSQQGKMSFSPTAIMKYILYLGIIVPCVLQAMQQPRAQTQNPIITQVEHMYYMQQELLRSLQQAQQTVAQGSITRQLCAPDKTEALLSSFEQGAQDAFLKDPMIFQLILRAKELLVQKEYVIANFKHKVQEVINLHVSNNDTLKSNNLFLKAQIVKLEQQVKTYEQEITNRDQKIKMLEFNLAQNQASSYH